MTQVHAPNGTAQHAQHAQHADPRSDARGERERAHAPREVVVKCVGLTKLFKDFWMRNRVRAVNEIDLEVRRGEVFGLLGPNGSGKSTTIKLLLGLLHPTAGRIAIFGKRPEDVKIKKEIGYLPEDSHLYRFLNARETLDYYGRLFHQTRIQRKRRIDELLHMVGLDAVQRRPIGEYSKGMQRRIGLAQALINDPQLLILDEPTSGLDPLGTRQIKDLILSLRDRGKTILLSSHLLADCEDVCDRVSIMFGGRIRAHGTVDELLMQDDLTTIETQSLDQSAIDQIDQLLGRHGRHIERVTRPRQKLESLFLEIVRQAQEEGAATSGASGGGGIAEFLLDQSDADTRDVEGEQSSDSQVIDRLVKGDERSTTGPTGVEPTEAEPTEAERSTPDREFAAVGGEHAEDARADREAIGSASDARAGAGASASASASDNGLIEELTGGPERRTGSGARAQSGGAGSGASESAGGSAAGAGRGSMAEPGPHEQGDSIGSAAAREAQTETGAQDESGEEGGARREADRSVLDGLMADESGAESPTEKDAGEAHQDRRATKSRSERS